MGSDQRAVTLADIALQALVLVCVIEAAPEPVPIGDLPILIFEGRFSPDEKADTLRAAEWLGEVLKPASPPTGLARAD